MAKASAFEINNKFADFLKQEGLAEKKDEIDAVLERNRNKPGALIPVLQHIQKELNYIPAVVQDYIARGLDVPSSYVYGVVSFYSFFTMVPRGEHVVRICMGTACYVKGGKKIVENLEKGLNIKPGETTQDRKYTLEVVRCLGACGLAPIMVVDDNTHGRTNPNKCMDIVKSYA